MAENSEDKIKLADIPSDIKNFKNLSQGKKNAYIGWVIGIVIVWILISIFSGHNYSPEELGLIENAKREVGSFISKYCGSVPSSDIEYSVYKIEGSKCILKCKSNNHAVVNAYGNTFYGGFVLNANYSSKTYVSSDLSTVKDKIGW